MSSPLPPDPYRALGVDKSATSAEIRTAYRKLVLKCHPDKVKEPTLKAIKQEEFQKVQQAYELLNDDNKRVQYDEQVKLFELRREMGRGMGRENPTSRSNPFEYDVRTAEPRSAPYSSPRSKESPNAYARPMPRSYEDPSYAEPRSARKSASYESARDEELRRERKAQAAQEEAERERYRAKMEKDAKRATHSKREKTRDKERKRGTEEKFRHTYAEDGDSDEYSHTPPKSDKKSARRMEEEIRMRSEDTRERERERERDNEPILTSKWDDHKEYAAQYMQAARAKGMEKSKEGFPSMPSMRRAETFAASPSYSVRYAAHSAVPPPAPSPYPPSDDDTPRRSSARSSSRRPSETPGRNREKSRTKPDKRTRDPYIVEPPSPPPSMKKPGLHSYSSAPPIIPNVYTATPSRSQSMQSQYSRKDSAPPMARAATFNVGDSSRSRMKKSMEFDSESDAETPVYASHRTSSPPPRETRYHVSGGRTIPIPHRDDEYARARTPSPSPRSRLAPERGSSGRQRQYHTDDREPIVIPIHPKMSPRETGHRSSATRSSPPYDQVKWSPNYTPADVVYTSVPPSYRREGDSNHRDYSYPPRSREAAYA